MATGGLLAQHDTHVSGAFFDELRRACALMRDSLQWELRRKSEWQQEKLRTLVTQCVENVPFYRGRFRGIDLSSQDFIERFPVTTRAEYRNASPSDRLASKGPEHSRPLGFMRTSGTTGEPVTIAATKMVRVWRSASILRELEQFELRPEWSCAIIRTPVSHGDQSWDDSIGAARRSSWLSEELRELVGMGEGFDFDIRLAPSQIAAGIRKMQPDLLYGTPSMMLSMTDLLHDFRPKAIMTTSEQLFDSEKLRIEREYSCPVCDVFGTVEFNRVAFWCRQCRVYHVHDENVLLEVLNDDLQPVQPGETGKLFATSLHNLATPLIRYEVGDLAERAEFPNRCGCTLSSISRFHGRHVSRIAIGDDKFRVATGLVISLLDQPEFQRTQLHQLGWANFRLLYVSEQPITSRAEKEVLTMVRDLIGTEPKIEFQRVERIQPLPNGKTPPVIVSQELLSDRR